jgi:ATP-dependent protease ClpP protease subunit
MFAPIRTTRKRTYNDVAPYFLNKKRKQVQNDEEEEDDRNEEDPEVQGLPDEIKEMIVNKLIYRSENHIYFRTDVTIKTINKLIDLINKANREFELTQLTLKLGKLEPSPLYLHITSNGGDLLAGLLAVDTIVNSKLPIYTVVEGYAISAASLMSVAGNKRFITENSFMLIHQLSDGAGAQTYEQQKDRMLTNRSLMEKINEIYVKYTGGKLTKKKLAEFLRHDIFWNAKTCLKAGLVDDIYKGEPQLVQVSAN